MVRALVLALLLVVALGASAGEVVRVPPFELHSSFWMSLHQTLMADAASPTPRDLSMVTEEERKAWNEAVDEYRKAAGKTDNITFAQPMTHTSDALTQIADDAVSPITDAPMAAALLRAAPVYAKWQWGADDRANRFFIAYAAAMLRDAGAELIRAHEIAYQTAWPQLVRVYITPHAGPFGAYTFRGRSGGVITTMSSRDAGYQGLHALEMILHEGSHAIVDPYNGTVAKAISAAAKKHGVEVPGGLWHAILFATSSHYTVQALKSRGVTQFSASANDLLTRVWPQFRAPIEQHWIAYLKGEGTLEEAIDKVVAAIPRPAKPSP